MRTGARRKSSNENWFVVSCANALFMRTSPAAAGAMHSKNSLRRSIIYFISGNEAGVPPAFANVRGGAVVQPDAAGASSGLVLSRTSFWKRQAGLPGHYASAHPQDENPLAF